MAKRVFFVLVGVGAGVTLGVWTVRKLEAARRALTAEELGARAGGFGARLADAVEQGRAAAAAKETELRGVYRVHEPPQPRH